MKTKYTKGDWKLQKTTTADKLILSHTDCVIIDCNHHYIKPAVAFGKDKEEAESNAKLIASAPELLDNNIKNLVFLKGMLKILKLTHQNILANECEIRILATEEAIKKATE